MVVDVRWIDTPNSAWLVEVVSTDNDEIKIRIGVNGRITLKTISGSMELWPGFPEEHDPFYDRDDDNEDGDV